ncbi:tRNA(His) guanylyltransferase Thg1 family protein [uncultured Methanobrevibacter sp.]|uniref:tRNA(His) guanylyltransferase Thg1 family protein n=1 Tax=uncultured Methanobrevibacter sp. TaxID=253161 RepID=UPI0026352522|nr:tRNA(His) guanylyltransferase Thg1 family protein [uncultured Methanobrevibacter sp.]
MKEHEVYRDLKVPINSKIILRLDGRSFHSLSRNLNLKKPYDENFAKLMVDVSKDLFNEFAPLFIYTFSDEISILLDSIPFNGRIEKINSVIASFAASSFTYNLNKHITKPIAFDSRIIPIVDTDIPKYFKWRQDESWRNCINAYGIHTLKSKYNDKVANEKINGLKSRDIHELLFNEGINLNNINNWKKRGIAIYKKHKKIVGYNKKKNKNQVSYRNCLFVDLEIPIFNENFFKDINII